MGRVSYFTKRHLQIIKYWFKILTAPENKYIKLIYRMMLHDLEVLPHKANWASLVRQLLMSLGFYEVWLAQGVGNVDVFLSTFKQRLTDNFIQNWHDRINGSTRANLYTAIAQFRLQTYLENINIYKHLQAMSKLRMSSHRLAIESGRWVKPIRLPIEERKCTDCNVSEDEYHFILNVIDTRN